MKRPPVIGVTGGFGTGKTSVARMFARLGAEVLDADRIAHEVILPGRPVYKKVISLFGADILARNGRIDRKRIGRIVFSDKKKLALLNSLIHPAVIKEMKARVARERAGKIFVADVPLLFEAGLEGMVDIIVLVSAGRGQQIARCRRKWKMTRSEVEKRIRSQMPLSKKARMADFIIDNSSTINSTKKEVEKIWREISHE